MAAVGFIGMGQRNRPFVPEKCPYQKKCGGCRIMPDEYDEQLDTKQNRVEEEIRSVCKTIHPIVGMFYPYHYRNKVHAAFGIDDRGHVIAGTYRGGTHEIVPIKACLIEDKKSDEVIATIRDMIHSFKIKTYDEDTGYGTLRHVMVRRGFSSGQLMVVLVTADVLLPSKNNFVKALREIHPEITTIVQNINDKHTSMVLGEREIVLYGKGYIEDQLLGCTFRISPRSFYQVNAKQTEVLYKRAIAAAALTGKENVVDTYCGIGTIGLLASRHAGHVTGIELNQDAARDAVENAKFNDIHNAHFVCADSTQWMQQAAYDKKKVDVLFMDPPRAGSTDEFIHAAASLTPSRIVYISCNPETLARDLKTYQKAGYEAREAWPVDLFPWTEHVETVVLLTRKDK